MGGIKKFTGNFVTHLKQAFISWLTGALSAIEMPEQFDLMGVLSIARQVLGLTWDYLKEKAAELIGEENVERLEWLIEQIRTLIEGGWGALLAKIKDQLTGLKDQIFDKIKEFILVSVVKKAVVKLASMFSPVGAVVQLVMTLWDVFQTLREQLSQIFEVVKTVVDALDKIVKGTLEPAQKKVEEVLAGILPVAIGLLARLVGLGGLGKKVEEFIESIRERVDKAITKLINKIKAKIKKLFGKGKKGKEDGEEEGAEGVPAALSQKRAFQAGGETHHLWVEKRRGRLVPLVASKEQTVEESVDNAPDEKKDDAAEADTVLGRLERELKRFEDDDRRGNLDEVDSLEAKLTEELVPLVAASAGEKAEHLLAHLREFENTAGGIESGLEKGLKSHEAPAPETRLPETLNNVYEARPTLKPVFDASSSVGKDLVDDLVQIKVEQPLGDTKVVKRFERDGEKTAFYTQLRTEVSSGEHDTSVRHPILIDEVLSRTSPGIPGKVEGALEEWLERAELTELPDSVRKDILETIQEAELEIEKRGAEKHVVIASSSAGAIRDILEQAGKATGNASFYDRWADLLFTVMQGFQAKMGTINRCGDRGRNAVDGWCGPGGTSSGTDLRLEESLEEEDRIVRMAEGDPKVFEPWGLCPVPKDFAELSRLVFEVCRWPNSIGGDALDTGIVWRGLADSTWKLESTLTRRMKDHWNTVNLYEQQDAISDQPIERELHLTILEEHARARESDLLTKAGALGFDREEGQRLTDIELMVKLRHYGAAVRLVDFTRSFHIALWFACSDHRHRDKPGALIGVAVPGRSNVAALITEGARHGEDYGTRKINHWTTTGEQNEFWKWLGPKDQKNYRKRLESEDEWLAEYYCYIPRPRFERLSAQKSCFLFGRVVPSKWGTLPLINDEQLARANFNEYAGMNAIIITPELKAQLLENFESLFGLSRDDIYPDIEGFASNNGWTEPFLPQHISPLQRHKAHDSTEDKD